jgi:hypothetical protein
VISEGGERLLGPIAQTYVKPSLGILLVRPDFKFDILTVVEYPEGQEGAI